jgi:hypothetical protein
MNRDKDLRPKEDVVQYSTGLRNEKYVSSQKGVFSIKK